MISPDQVIAAKKNANCPARHTVGDQITRANKMSSEGKQQNHSTCYYTHCEKQFEAEM